MGKEKGGGGGGGMRFGMAGGALLVLRESESLLGELKLASDGLVFSLTMKDSSV